MTEMVRKDIQMSKKLNEMTQRLPEIIRKEGGE